MTPLREFKSSIMSLMMLWSTVSLFCYIVFISSGWQLFYELSQMFIGSAIGYLVVRLLLDHSPLNRLEEMNQNLIEENQRLAHENRLFRDHRHLEEKK